MNGRFLGIKEVLRFFGVDVEKEKQVQVVDRIVCVGSENRRCGQEKYEFFSNESWTKCEMYNVKFAKSEMRNVQIFFERFHFKSWEWGQHPENI